MAGTAHSGAGSDRAYTQAQCWRQSSQVPAALRGGPEGTDHPHPHVVWWELATCPLPFRRLPGTGKEEDQLLVDSDVHSGHVPGRARMTDKGHLNPVS